VAEAGLVFPGALEPERFFGRIEELRLLRRQARALVRGLGRSRVLCARPGSGKTELLRQWHGRLFLEGEIFPFWYTVPREIVDRATLGGAYVAALALQALAFRRRDPLLLARPLPPAELAEGLRSTWGDGGVLLAEALAGLDPGARGPAALAAAAVVPHRLAALTGTRVLCILDDAGNLATGRGDHPWPEEAIGSSIAPLLATVEDEGLVPRIFGHASASSLSLDRLAPLSAEATSRLARHLARTAGLELAEQAIAALAGESAGSPFYLGALVRALADGTGTGTLDVVRAAASAACEGELARYWAELLARAIPDRRTRATALEILTYCLRGGAGCPDAGRLATLMLKPEADVETALAGLSSAGVVRVGCTSIEVDQDPVFHTVVQALYRREFGRMTPASVVATLAAEKVRTAPSVRRRLWREAVRGALRGILGAWAGQQVPSDLFDAAAWCDRRGAAGRAPGGGDDAPPGGSEVVTLPQVVSVASGRVGNGVSLPGLEVDALAWALRAEAGTPDAEVAWVARLLPGGSGGSEQLAQFDRDVAALQMAGELPAARVVRWAILETPLDGPGAATAARLRLSTSTWPQLEALAGLLGVATVPPPPGAAAAAEEALEIELVIPRVADVELVAARALEQLAENLAIDAAVTGRLKMAVVEACINAFEHAGVADGRVRLVYSVAGGRLLMRVENRGRPLAALPSPAAAGRDARGRGWGLTLIRELVDEVVLEPREDGVSLLMVKHLGRGEHG
jgi:anti-sigma regulatory factor (Ser/Thr protein kinase)